MASSFVVFAVRVTLALESLRIKTCAKRRSRLRIPRKKLVDIAQDVSGHGKDVRGHPDAGSPRMFAHDLIPGMPLEM
jgi:hypothetical protein